MARKPPRAEPFGPVRDIDPDWSARLDAAERGFQRRERQASTRRAGAVLLLAIVVVTSGVALLRWETDTRSAPRSRPALVWVTVPPRR